MILEDFLTNPYDVTIGEMIVGLNEYDQYLVEELLSLMQLSKIDYTIFFRNSHDYFV